MLVEAHRLLVADGLRELSIDMLPSLKRHLCSCHCCLVGSPSANDTVWGKRRIRDSSPSCCSALCDFELSAALRWLNSFSDLGYDGSVRWKARLVWRSDRSLCDVPAHKNRPRQATLQSGGCRPTPCQRKKKATWSQDESRFHAKPHPMFEAFASSEGDDDEEDKDVHSLSQSGLRMARSPKHL